MKPESSNIPAPAAITPALIQQVSDAVGDLVGWDFSRAVTDREPTPWQYTTIVEQYLQPTARVLDVGTGGGEIFLALSSCFREGVAIDQSERQIATALANQTCGANTNVTFLQMDASHLEFPEAAFDLVLNRRCGIYPAEVARVLRPGGYFISEQVGQRKDINFVEAFGWSAASFGSHWWQPQAEIIRQFEQLGCRLVARGEYEVRYWLRDFASLIFYLKARPWPGDAPGTGIADFDVVEQWQGVQQIVERYASERGIETREHLELLIVQQGAT